MPERTVIFNALAYTPTGAGISRYVRELGRELLSLRDDVWLAAQAGPAETSFPGERTIPFSRTPSSKRRILMEQFWLPLRGRRFSLAHYPDCFVPAIRPWPVVVTCHDISFIACSGTFTHGQTLWKRHCARRAANRADMVICDSQSTADDFRNAFGVGDDRIRVVYPGVRPYAGPAEAPTAPLPEGQFILAVGTLEPRKNYARLLEALRILRGEGAEINLVIAGGKGWLYDSLFACIAESGLSGHVAVLGYCTEGELRWLYENARALAYVSLYEGFGFPPLEAMARGLPVVASRVSSIPEVCGEAAHYVDARSEEDIARGLAEVLRCPDLRAALRAAGEERHRLFDWRETAAAVSAAYDVILGA